MAGQPPDAVEFTYGSTVETVSGSDEVTWMFDAGEPGATIQAKAIQGAEESLLFTINAPKVAVPGWAGTPIHSVAGPLRCQTTREPEGHQGNLESVDSNSC